MHVDALSHPVDFGRMRDLHQRAQSGLGRLGEGFRVTDEDPARLVHVQFEEMFQFAPQVFPLRDVFLEMRIDRKHVR